MSLEKIKAISGKPGLYKIKTQTRGGFIAESLLNNKKMPVNLQHNVSMLSEIAIYTYESEVSLEKVFAKIKEKENGNKTINHKESKAKLEECFREVLPEFDEDRVYTSDLKKVFQWYNLLHDADMTDFKIEDEKGDEETENEDSKSNDDGESDSEGAKNGS